MDYKQAVNNVLHWNYRGFTEFPLRDLEGEETEITDIYLKENLISRIPSDIGRLNNLESLYLSGNDITNLPREISKLTCLKCLDLSGNRLQYIPSEIGEMRNLKFLTLDENELRELPLRIAELRMLRYLSIYCTRTRGGAAGGGLRRCTVSVCRSAHAGRRIAFSRAFHSLQCALTAAPPACRRDNKLKWVPQRPVFNYHHCEFRFWRNRNLSTIPYSLWYHMFRGQQTRSINIGCFGNSICEDINNNNTLTLILGRTDKALNRREIHFPRKYDHNINRNIFTIPSLMELCKRKFYQMLENASKKLTTSPTISIYADSNSYDDKFENNNNVISLQENFGEINLKTAHCSKKDINEEYYEKCTGDTKVDKLFIKSKMKGYCVPSDIVEEHYYFLPKFLRDDLCNGPISKCENVTCKKPMFDFVNYEFCIEKIILIENTEDVILSAEFCSKACADKWKAGKAVLIWEFI